MKVYATLILFALCLVLSACAYSWVAYNPTSVEIQEDPDKVFDATVRVFARRGFGIHNSNSRGRVLETDWVRPYRGWSLEAAYRVFISKNSIEIFTDCTDPLNFRRNCKNERPNGTVEFEKQLIADILEEAKSL